MEDATAPGCPTSGKPEKAGTIADNALVETSGLAPSARSANVLWANNDSGDSARLFAIHPDGTSIATIKIDGASATDWEAIATAPKGNAQAPAIFIADIGDNPSTRPNVTIYVVPEPILDSGPIPASVTVARKIVLTYEDKPHNAEALLVDPSGGEIVIVTKEIDGASGVFAVSDPQSTTTSTLVRKTTLAFGKGDLAGDVLVTDGSVSPDGTLIALRTYANAFLWKRAPGASIADTLKNTRPCKIATTAETQGEAIAFAADKPGYFTTSEGAKQPIWFFSLSF